MEAVRAAIEKQVLSLTGLALGGVDFENPPGDPGLFGPRSIIWQVHRDFTSMLCGGVSALLLQMLHPLALAGVWDHSNFREDMIGRLRRTSQFVSVTTFGPTAEAERLIAKVKAIHLRVTGVGSDGTPYAASDPALLTWYTSRRAAVFWPATCATATPIFPAICRINTTAKPRAWPPRWGRPQFLSPARRSKSTCRRCGRSWSAMNARKRWRAFC